MVLPCSCSCQNSSVCVATEWVRSRKNSGYKRIFAGFFFQADQIPNLLHVPAAHTAITARVWKWSCVISALQMSCWEERGCYSFFPCKLLLPKPDKYQQNLLQTFSIQIPFNAGKFSTVILRMPSLSEDHAPVHCSESFPAKGRASLL